MYCEYISAMKNYLYSQAWMDRLVGLLSTEDGFREALGTDPVPLGVIRLSQLADLTRTCACRLFGR